MKNDIPAEIAHTKYFASPGEAIPVISDLLKNQDFKILASYYDLSFSKIKRADLESGEFFIRNKRPGAAHPAELWRYRTPFAPGSKFDSIQSTGKERVYLIRVMIEIDQGTGFPNQAGFAHFYMIRSARGWRILPDLY